MIPASYNAASNQPVPGAGGANEEGAFMNIPAAERVYRPLARVRDDVLATGGFASAFSHTRFKRPRPDLEASFSQAARIV